MPLKRIKVKSYLRRVKGGRKRRVKSHTRVIHGAKPVRVLRGTEQSRRGANVFTLVSASPEEIIYRDYKNRRLVIDQSLHHRPDGSKRPWRLREFWEDHNYDTKQRFLGNFNSRRGANIKARSIIKKRTGQKPAYDHESPGMRGYY